MLTKYCRICLTSASVVNQLDEVVHKSLTLYAMLCKLYPEAFSGCENHQWPTRVCGNCKHGILEAYRLYAVCMSTFSVLKNQLPNSLIKPCQLTFQSDRPVTSNSFSGQDGIDFKNTVIIIDDEEDDKRSPMDEQEVKFYTQNEKTDDEEHDSCETFLMGEQAIAHESIKNTSLALEPLNAEIFKVDSAAATCKTANTVGQPIKMATSIDQGQEEDSRESMDFLDDVEKHKRHMEAHMPEGSWACQLCPLRFSTQTAMNSHEYIHKKDIRHCCDICGVNLSSKRNLKYHQRAVHEGGIEKLHPCNVCGRRFAIPSMLKSHMNTHTGHRPYSCVYCNRVYGSGGDLVEHVAKHHVGNDNIYQCHLCDADFPKIKKLKDHYEVHYRNGEKLDNEILTEFGRFRFTIMDLLKMRRRKETTALSNDNANN
ncbi:PR domain zinc finger protein 5-like [Anopheles darlingi]|uniref:PR domain zinc finger protein 5-like n=1 Tax=Anopheles darlingi TaxID=43151 RepID=UPI002100621F|nr:PR domain zinc finger protein 5-like [Anopheles darlingi]